MLYTSLRNEGSLIYTWKTILLWSSPGQSVVLCTHSAPRGLRGCPHAACTLQSHETLTGCRLLCSISLCSHIWFSFDFHFFFIMIVWNMAFHWMSSPRAANGAESQKARASPGTAGLITGKCEFYFLWGLLGDKVFCALLCKKIHANIRGAIVELIKKTQPHNFSPANQR